MANPITAQIRGEVRHVIVALSLVAAFAVALFGVPSCSMRSGAGATTLRRADRLVATGRFSEALPLALENRERNPGDPAAAWQLARVYQGLGALADEAAAWEVYLQTSPPTGDVCLRLADVDRRLGRSQQATAIVDRCLALDDRQPELLKLRPAAP